MNKLIKLMESNQQDMSNLEEQEKYFEERTNKHIGLVKDAIYVVIDNFDKLFPESAQKSWPANFDYIGMQNSLAIRANTHDSSKLVEPERTPYVSITWRHKLEKEKEEFDPINNKGYQTPGLLDKKEENEATLHHITTNSHHPEYWNKEEANLDPQDRNKSRKCIDASSMETVPVIEMVCDWGAMAKEVKKNTARQWFEKQRNIRWHFSEEQEKLIDRVLTILEENYD